MRLKPHSTRRGSVPLARRNVLADGRRLTISVLGVAAAVALILLLQGLWSGFRTQVSTYEDHVGADLFVGDAGTRNFLGVPSVLPMEAVSSVRAIPGVDDAEPVAARFAVLDLHGQKQFTFLIGSIPGRLGGPWNVSAGRAARTDDEIVVDRTLAEQHGIGLGDNLEVMGTSLRVVGLSDETRSWMASFVFTTHSTVERMLRMPETTSYVLVRTAEPEAVAEAIRDGTDLTVLTPAQLGDNDRALLARIMNAPLSLMLLIAFAAGTLIIALAVYSAVVERTREYGIIKALGAGRGRLFRIVLGQSAVIAALGTIAGYLLFRGAAGLVGTLRPQMWVEVSWVAAAGAGFVAASMALLAALVPTRHVARLDPASVYGGR
jgi:putative ABC transport system permease protein